MGERVVVIPQTELASLKADFKRCEEERAKMQESWTEENRRWQDESTRADVAEAKCERLEEALRTIRGPEDRGPWMLIYREAGGGYQGLQAIAQAALDSMADCVAAADRGADRSGCGDPGSPLPRSKWEGVPPPTPKTAEARNVIGVCDTCGWPADQPGTRMVTAPHGGYNSESCPDPIHSSTPKTEGER